MVYFFKITTLFPQAYSYSSTSSGQIMNPKNNSYSEIKEKKIKIKMMWLDFQIKIKKEKLKLVGNGYWSMIEIEMK